MIGSPTEIALGAPTVRVVNNRGFTPDEMADFAVDKIISISDTASPEAKAQAHAFRNHIHSIIRFYLSAAVKSDRTTLSNRLNEMGHHEVASIIRSI
jgi:hypothetical protein